MNNTVFIAFIIFIFALVAEYLHILKCKKVEKLSHGKHNKARTWTLIIPWVRCIAVYLIAWGLITLFKIDPSVHQKSPSDDKELRRIIIIYDISPSMQVPDAGTSKQTTRRTRAANQCVKILNSLSPAEFMVSIIAVHSDAKAVVINGKDLNVVHVILKDLPIEYAFKKGQTDLISGLKKASEMCKMWPKDSTALMVFSDGDTVDKENLPKLPNAIDKVFVFGLGHPFKSSRVGSAYSKQEKSALVKIARRYRGEYLNINKDNIPEQMVEGIADPMIFTGTGKIGSKEVATSSILLGSIILSLLLILQQMFGSAWKTASIKPLARGLQ